MDQEERFWVSTIEELKQGYVFEEAEGAYYCLICGDRFEDGEIFHDAQAGRWYEARKYAALHVEQEHGSMLDYLLELDKKQTGLTDLQKELIRGFADHLSDTEMMGRTGAGSASTIRNHRFVLKEKAKQAKLLLAIMEMMEEGAVAAPRFVPVHRTARQVDERYAITEEEYAELLKQYLPNGPDGPLESFPRKEKRKVALLRHIASYFERGVRYTEKEVNARLSAFWEEDYVTLRRYLIEYGYLDRKDDGSTYWIKGAGGEQQEIGEQQEQAAPKAALAGKKAKAGKKKAAKEEQKLEELRESGPKMDKAKRKQLTADYQERERMMGVFQIKNNANGKIYVGGSTNLDALWGKEQFILNMDTHPNRELQKEWKQFGGENFSFLILETVKLDQKIRYDYKDVLDPVGRQPVDLVRQYNREVGDLKEQWVEKLRPFGEKGYHGLADKGNG
ncbi:DUF2087 domain-containing protein [Paenibacillus sp. PL91]|uniref:DUF2087 domain-containing protein n=1 Tax=Paenibacillus sp. PL91 TaxID=2729538 RepID=UPI00145CCB4C|nr:DUF2087 domain-containing protein [Paenibacillus sp. PL91]MBC9200504.1 DUF2087 domain-containing protein [Paenibacillus sp. PL91]